MSAPYPQGFPQWPQAERDDYFAQAARDYDNRQVFEAARRLGTNPEAIQRALGNWNRAPAPDVEELKPDRLPYPVDSLGGTLGSAARAIAAKVQCPVEMAAQSVLAVASLAVQAVADVRMPYGQTRPLSLYVLTVAASGDRKSTADQEALVPVRMREKALGNRYEPALEGHKVDLRAWRAQVSQVERNKSDLASRKADLARLGPEPAAPIWPVLTIDETTHEGLSKCLPSLPGAVGVFSAEGAKFLGGYGFANEKKLATAAAFSTFWDGGNFRRLRAGDGMTDLKGRRVAAHLMIQPAAANSVLSDPVLRDQGLLARLLIAAPASLVGTRMWKEPSQDLEPALKRYAARVLSIFEAPVFATNELQNELDPPALVLSQPAHRVWVDLLNEVERDARPGGRFAGLTDVAGKAAEQAARIAGILAIVDQVDATEIDERTMRRGCDLARWYLAEALRLTRSAPEALEVTAGDALLEWLRASGQREVSGRDVQRFGPPILRKKQAVEDAIKSLVDNGDLVPVEGSRKKAWRLTDLSPARPRSARP